MKNIFRAFVVKISVISAVLMAIALILVFLFPSEIITRALPLQVIFFFVVNITVYYFMLRLTEGKFSRFVNLFMVLTFLKLFVYIATVTVYSLLMRHDVIPFVGAFFILYLIYTILEVVSFTGDQRKLQNLITKTGETPES